MKLNSPRHIQNFLNQCAYNKKNYTRSALRVFHEKKAHCLEGALFAAWALEKINITPFFLDFRAEGDDDHVACIYQINNLWGAIAQSSTTLLKARPPAFISVRELVMSYYPFYFCTKGKLSLRSWSGPIPIAYFSKWNWRDGAEDLQDMSIDFNKLAGNPIIIAQKHAKQLKPHQKVSKLLLKACFLKP